MHSYLITSSSIGFVRYSKQLVQCPLLALSGHSRVAIACPLLGVKRTLISGCTPTSILCVRALIPARAKKKEAAPPKSGGPRILLAFSYQQRTHHALAKLAEPCGIALTN